MPIFAHVPLLQRLTGLIYFPINHAFPHFGLAAGLMYLPAKFRIRFLEPVDLSAYGPEDADDMALVGTARRGHPAADPGGAGRPGTGAQVGLVRLGSPVVGTRVRACAGAGGRRQRCSPGCGDDDFKNEARAPVRVELTGVIQDDKVTVSPAKIGAGPVVITISNQTDSAHTITLEGESIIEEQGPVAAGDTATIQKTLEPGSYEVQRRLREGGAARRSSRRCSRSARSARTRTTTCCCPRPGISSSWSSGRRPRAAASASAPAARARRSPRAGPRTRAAIVSTSSYALSMLVLAPVSCCLTLRSSASAASARSAASRTAPASMPSASDALHQHARARQPVADLERQRRRRRGRAPRPACRRCTRAAAPAWPAPRPRWARPARRSRRCARPSPVQLARAPRAATAACPWPRTRCARAPGRCRRRSPRPRRRPCRWPPCRSPTASATSPCAQRDRVDRVGHRLLEAAPLGGAALALGLDLLELLLLVAQRLQLLLQLGQLLEQRALRGVASGWRPGGSRGRPRLEVGERVALVGRRELAHQVLARLGERLADRLAHAVLHRGGAAVAEARSSSFASWPSSLAEHLRELGLEELARSCAPAR